MSDPSSRKGKSKDESQSKSGTSSESSLEPWDPEGVEGRQYPSSMARFSGYHNDYIPSSRVLRQMTQEALTSSTTSATSTNRRDVQPSYDAPSTSQASRPSDKVRYDEETGEWHFPEHGGSETGTRPPSSKTEKKQTNKQAKRVEYFQNNPKAARTHRKESLDWYYTNKEAISKRRREKRQRDQRHERGEYTPSPSEEEGPPPAPRKKRHD